MDQWIRKWKVNDLFADNLQEKTTYLNMPKYLSAGASLCTQLFIADIFQR